MPVHGERHHEAAEAHQRRSDHHAEEHQGEGLDLRDVVGGAGEQGPGAKRSKASDARLNPGPCNPPGAGGRDGAAAIL